MGDDSEDRRQQKTTYTLHTAHALQAHSYSDDDTVSEEEPPSPRRAEGEVPLVPITCVLDTGTGPISFAKPSLLHNLREAPPQKVFDASGTAQKVSQRGDLQLTLQGGLRVDIVAYAADWVSHTLISARQAVSAGWTLQASARQWYLRIENDEAVWLLELNKAFQLHARMVMPKRTTGVTPARSAPPTPPRQYGVSYKPELLP
jgi:hypothetical protein